MAYSLPSFNAAVASANTSGVPLQRLQAGIDFGDVKSTIGTQAMLQVPFTQFAMEAAMARDGLKQLAANFRQKRDLDYAMDIAEMRREDAKKARLMSMLNSSNQSGSGSGMFEPLDLLNQYRSKVTAQDRYDATEAGVLDPMATLGAQLNNIPLGGQSQQTAQTSVAPATTSKVEATPQAKALDTRGARAILDSFLK